MIILLEWISDGLYFSNGTHILYSQNPSGGESSVAYSQVRVTWSMHNLYVTIYT